MLADLNSRPEDGQQHHQDEAVKTTARHPPSVRRKSRRELGEAALGQPVGLTTTAPNGTRAVQNAAMEDVTQVESIAPAPRQDVIVGD
jgi:hypothetical protein